MYYVLNQVWCRFRMTFFVSYNITVFQKLISIRLFIIEQHSYIVLFKISNPRVHCF